MKGMIMKKIILSISSWVNSLGPSLEIFFLGSGSVLSCSSILALSSRSISAEFDSTLTSSEKRSFSFASKG